MPRSFDRYEIALEDRGEDRVVMVKKVFKDIDIAEPYSKHCSYLCGRIGARVGSTD